MQQLKPVFLAVGLVCVLLMLAWLGASNQTLHAHRPTVFLIVEGDAIESKAQPIIDDLRYRMDTHHGYRVVRTELDARYLVYVEPVVLSDGFRVYADLRVGPQGLGSQGSALGYRNLVQGPIGSELFLSEQLFRLINQAIVAAQEG